MKILLILVATLTTLHSIGQTEDNQELTKIYTDFERDHSARRIDRDLRNDRDSIRQIRVLEILDLTKAPTSNDYANAAAVLSSAENEISDDRVIELMTKSIELDPTRDKALLARVIDRRLVRLEKPQLYGTQSYLGIADSSWGLVMYEVDSIQVSDSDRIEYGVRTLAEQRKYLNSKLDRPLNDMMSEGMSFEEVIAFCKKEFKENPSSKYVSENTLDRFAFQLGRNEEMELSEKAYEFVTQLYPNSFNAFDILGDYYFKSEQYEKGVVAYERSLEINPYKEYARLKIEEYKNR